MHVIEEIVQGHPVEVLREAATGAGLLVVGTHGYGTFSRHGARLGQPGDAPALPGTPRRGPVPHRGPRSPPLRTLATTAGGRRPSRWR
ncbi:hypothetical protein ACFSTC_28980 [Nonomuraea ferruginea]